MMPTLATLDLRAPLGRSSRLSGSIWGSRGLLLGYPLRQGGVRQGGVGLGESCAMIVSARLLASRSWFRDERRCRLPGRPPAPCRRRVGPRRTRAAPPRRRRCRAVVVPVRRAAVASVVQPHVHGAVHPLVLYGSACHPLPDGIGPHAQRPRRLYYRVPTLQCRAPSCLPWCRASCPRRRGMVQARNVACTMPTRCCADARRRASDVVRCDPRPKVEVEGRDFRARVT
jgi:hypothetical protein